MVDAGDRTEAESQLPSGFSLAMKASEPPADVSVVLPKPALPEYEPVIQAEPSLRAVMP